MTSAGRGRVRGFEIFVEKKFTDKFFGQGNFSISRTRHAGLDGVFRSGSFDDPRVFNAVGGYRLTRKWELSARLSYVSGRPYTPFDEALSRTGAQNAVNRKNIAGYTWNRRSNQTELNEQLGVFPTVGLDWRF